MRGDDIWDRIKLGDQDDTGPADDLEQLEASVVSNLSRLLNTRSYDDLLGTRRDGASPTVLEFGLPALDDLSPVSAVGRDRVCARLRRTITCFEPRLRNPTVEMENPEEAMSGYLVIRVSGDLRAFRSDHPVQLDLRLNTAQKRVDPQTVETDEEL